MRSIAKQINLCPPPLLLFKSQVHLITSTCYRMATRLETIGDICGFMNLGNKLVSRHWKIYKPYLRKVFAGQHFHTQLTFLAISVVLYNMAKMYWGRRVSSRVVSLSERIVIYYLIPPRSIEITIHWSVCGNDRARIRDEEEDAYEKGS